MRTEQEKLYSKIRYQIMSWYLDEGDYQPTEEEAKVKSIQAISKVLSSQKQKMGEILEKQKQGANFIKGTYGQQRMKRIAQLKGYNACLSDIKQRMEDL